MKILKFPFSSNQMQEREGQRSEIPDKGRRIVIDDELVIKCPWRARIFHWSMVFLGMAVIFLFGGAVVWYLLNGDRSLEITRAKTAFASRGQFILGGILAVFWIVKLVHRPQEQRKGL